MRIIKASSSRGNEKELIKNVCTSILFIFLFAFMFTGCSKPGDATVRKAMRAYSDKDLDTAITLFKQAENEESHYSKELLYTFMSTVYSQQEDLPNAILYQKKALEIRPDYRGFVTLGMMNHMNGNDEEAIKNYDDAIKLDPDYAEAYASLAALYLGQGDAEKAVPLLEKAVQISPKLAVGQANLAVAYAMIGDTEKSDKALNCAASLKCENLDKFKERIDEIKSKKD